MPTHGTVFSATKRVFLFLVFDAHPLPSPCVIAFVGVIFVSPRHQPRSDRVAAGIYCCVGDFSRHQSSPIPFPSLPLGFVFWGFLLLFFPLAGVLAENPNFERGSYA